jgi:hypothetical protein
VDDSIYGTEEGAKLQKEAVDGGGKIIKKRKKKKKRKDKNDKGGSDAEGATLANDNVTNHDSHVRLKQSVAGVVVAGTLAAGISMFLGGGKRSQ